MAFFALFEISHTLATSEKSVVKNAISGATTTQHHCKKIETILQEIKKQLTQMQNDINMLKGNRSSSNGKIQFLCFIMDLIDS